MLRLFPLLALLPFAAHSQVTISVTVPVTAYEGENMAEVAARFCVRNGLGQEEANQITSALVAQYEAQLFDQRRLARCIKWQREHGVKPLVTWGTLPENDRKGWLELECDSVVPKTPEEPLASVPIRTDTDTLHLDFFRGDNIDQTVIDFCAANNVPVEQHGSALKTALLKAVEAALPPEPVKAERGKLLFTVPVSIGDQKLGLAVHEGDNLKPLVRQFCAENGIDEGAYGQALADAIMSNLRDLESSLKAQQESGQAQQEDAKEPGRVLFTIPVNINGNEVPLPVREGAMLNSVVSTFCTENGIDEAQYTEPLRKAVIQGFNAFNAKLREKESQ